MRAEWRAVGRIDTQIPGNEETVSKYSNTQKVWHDSCSC